MASEKITLPSQLPVAPWTERFSGTPQEKLRWRVQSCQARRGYKFTTTSKFTCVITKLMTSSMGLLLRCISVWHTNQQTMWLISSSCADRHLVNYTIWDFMDTQFNKEYHVLLLTFCLCRHMGFITSIVKVGVQIHYITKRFQWSLEAPIDSQGQISFSTVALSCIMTSWRGSSGPYDSWHVRQYQINTPPRAYQARRRTKHFRRQSSITWLACDVGGEGVQWRALQAAAVCCYSAWVTSPWRSESCTVFCGMRDFSDGYNIFHLKMFMILLLVEHSYGFQGSLFSSW